MELGFFSMEKRRLGETLPHSTITLKESIAEWGSVSSPMHQVIRGNSPKLWRGGGGRLDIREKFFNERTGCPGK